MLPLLAGWHEFEVYFGTQRDPVVDDKATLRSMGARPGSGPLLLWFWLVGPAITFHLLLPPSDHDNRPDPQPRDALITAPLSMELGALLDALLSGGRHMWRIEALDCKRDRWRKLCSEDTVAQAGILPGDQLMAMSAAWWG
jgi:hypothetical protein